MTNGALWGQGQRLPASACRLQKEKHSHAKTISLSLPHLFTSLNMHPELHSPLLVLPLLPGRAQLCYSLLPWTAQRWKTGPEHWQGAGHAGKSNPRLQRAHGSMNSQGVLLLQAASALRLIRIKVFSFTGQSKLTRQVTGGTLLTSSPNYYSRPRLVFPLKTLFVPAQLFHFPLRCSATSEATVTVKLCSHRVGEKLP